MGPFVRTFSFMGEVLGMVRQNPMLLAPVVLNLVIAVPVNITFAIVMAFAPPEYAGLLSYALLLFGLTALYFIDYFCASISNRHAPQPPGRGADIKELDGQARHRCAGSDIERVDQVLASVIVANEILSGHHAQPFLGSRGIERETARRPFSPEQRWWSTGFCTTRHRSPSQGIVVMQGIERPRQGTVASSGIRHYFDFEI